MLLTGDLEGRGEEQLVESGALESCPILKAGHHGSKNSGSEEFLQIVKPRLTLISAGIENRYGHPHEETLERLQEIGSEVLSTQECGAITLRSDGRKTKGSQVFIKPGTGEKRLLSKCWLFIYNRIVMKTLNEDLKSGQFKQVYLLCGEEGYLKKQYKNRFVKAMIPEGDTMNYSYYEGKNTPVKEAIDLAETLPFFAERRLIVFENTGVF